MRRRRTGLLVLALALLPALAGRGAETDPYYAWLRPPGDSTEALNARSNQLLEQALGEVNRSWWRDQMACHEVAEALVRPFLRTSMWFFVGGMDDFGLSPVPASNTEYRQAYAPWSIFRYSTIWKWGFLVPPDPTLKVGGVYISPDKVAHFFHEGWQYYEVWREAKARGRSDEEAHKEAIWHGIREESFLQGDAISGVFSYADLEANEQGFLFFRRLCDEETPALVLRKDGWQLEARLDFAALVNPCWDEAYYVSAFSPQVGAGVRRALLDYCPIRERPSVRRRLEAYEARGCSSFSYRYLEALTAEGAVPDRTPFEVDEVCRAAAGP